MITNHSIFEILIYFFVQNGKIKCYIRLFGQVQVNIIITFIFSRMLDLSQSELNQITNYITSDIYHSNYHTYIMIKDIKICLLRIHILLYSEVKSHYLSNQCLNISLQMHKLGPSYKFDETCSKK